MGKKKRKKTKDNDASSVRVDFNLDESEELLHRIESNALSRKDLKLLAALVRWYLWLITRVSRLGKGLG